MGAIWEYLKSEFNKGRNKGIEHRDKITKVIGKENKEVN